ncbi:MAG TPA: hypothetical protein VJJ75_01850 [Candidatus Nanoarchaeia archaeon]|nr:hypothetical protein [Candidatus Nanoarchaeia archaeon]
MKNVQIVFIFLGLIFLTACTTNIEETLKSKPIINSPAEARTQSTTCNNQEECTGSCVAELSSEEREQVTHGETIAKTGACTAEKLTLGCHAFVQQGKVSSILCLDY